MIKVFIFDLGKVIVDFDHMIICRKLSKHTNHSKEEVYDIIFNSGLEKSYDEGRITSRQFYKKMKKLVGAEIGYQDFSAIWSDIFSLNKPLLRLLHNLKGRYTLLLLSNTNDLHFRQIKSKFPEVLVFDDYVLSYKLGFRKPDKRIYRKALSLAKCKPGECVYIDDIKKYVDVAREFGMVGIRYVSMQDLKRKIKTLSNGLH